ncbi:MAG: lmo0937 family membrane protein [Chloroflexi bacterium]|nr:MAG: lmo0937 family membrane protein [Chloroflexota bacterium]
MGILELLIVILVILWLLGYFGRGRFYATGPSVSTAGVGSGNWLHILLVVAVILIILRLLGLV